MTDNVPGPPAWPFIGNALELRQGEFPLMAFNTLAEQYGPIYRIVTPAGPKRLIVSSQKLVNELCDEKRFQKLGGAPGGQGNSGSATAGLFFARNDDPDWGQAHRTLMPAFGPLNIQMMFDEMHDVAKQLALSWARRGSDYRIDVTDDFTRLTLDSIALCAMGYRFNSFYQAEMHPYVDAMTTMLGGIAMRSQQLPIVSRWKNTNGQIANAREEMSKIARDLVQVRRNNPTDKNDLLNAMIHGVDPKTGEKMRDDLIMANMNTFLIAGHETTSGLLSFAMYHLLKNPSAYKTMQEEVDRVVGQGALEPHHMKDLKYVNAVLRETLRLCPTAPAFTLGYKGKESHFTLGDYAVDAKTPIMVLLQKLHRDPEVYGEDAESFKPERMLDEEFNQLPPNAWKPFGNGVRACIGRSFAWQEAVMALAILFQRFNFRLDDPSYELQLQFALTIKPKGLFIYSTLRNGLDATDLERALNTASTSFKPKTKPALTTPNMQDSESNLQKLKILYGSNTGTCEALAQRLFVDANAHGFTADKAALDSANGDLPKDRPLVIVCPSYEGQPADNAIHFVEWLQNLSGEELKGTKYAVFGCGHHDWHDTFHRIPKLIDDLISKHGGERITGLGLCDVADANVMDQFDDWKDNYLWTAISKTEDKSSSSIAASESIPTFDLELATDKRAQALHQDVDQAVVLDAKTLTAPGEPEKRHLELQLPTDMTYKAGDYLVVLPLNPAATVRRVTKRFALPWDAAMKISAKGNNTSLPSDTWFAVHNALRGYVELSQPPSKKDLRRFISLTSDITAKTALEELLEDENKTKGFVSTLDVLERYPSISISFSEFLTLLPPLRVRLYSISSSPLNNPTTCTISYGVLDQPSATGWTSARHPGVASTYLASLQAGDQIHVAVRPSRSGFHLTPPTMSNPIPIIMICAGTGVAPFRAFVQERALQMKARDGDREQAGLGKALLFIGCRHENKDQLYKDKFLEWEQAGAVSVRNAFSKEKESAGGCGYVQDRLKADGKEVKEMWDGGAKIYICGASVLVREVARVLKEVLFEGLAEKEVMEQYSKATRAERIVTDVFG